MEFISTTLQVGDEVIVELKKPQEIEVEVRILGRVYNTPETFLGFRVEIIGIPGSDKVVKNKGAHYFFPFHSISQIRIMRH